MGKMGMMDEWADHSLAHEFAPTPASELTAIKLLLERVVELLEQGTRKKARKREPRIGTSSKTVMTESWLRVTLKINGPLSWATIATIAEEQGFSERTLRRVRHGIAVKDRRGRQVIWRLKED